MLGAGAWAGARLLLLSHEATAHLRGSEAFSPVVVRKLGGDLKQQTQRQQQQGPSSVNVLSPLLPPSSNDPWVGATPAAAVPAAHASSARAGEVAVSAGAALTAAAHVASTARPAADASVLARVDGGGHGTPEAAPSDAAMSMPPIISDRTSRVHSEQQGGLTTNITTTIARGNPVVPPNPAAPAGTSPGALSTSAAPGGAEPGPAGALPPLLIPRILHHNYLSGVQELQRVAASPKTHFRWGTEGVGVSGGCRSPTQWHRHTHDNMQQAVLYGMLLAHKPLRTAAPCWHLAARSWSHRRAAVSM